MHRCNYLQAAARTNDLAGDGTTTATILSAAMIAEGMKIVAAGANPVQVGSVERVQHHVSSWGSNCLHAHTRLDSLST